jgi:hypothetical protein
MTSGCRGPEGLSEAEARFLEGELKPKASREKSRVGSHLKLKFLGFFLRKAMTRPGYGFTRKASSGSRTM